MCVKMMCLSHVIIPLMLLYMQGRNLLSHLISFFFLRSYRRIWNSKSRNLSLHLEERWPTNHCSRSHSSSSLWTILNPQLSILLCAWLLCVCIVMTKSIHHWMSLWCTACICVCTPELATGMTDPQDTPHILWVVYLWSRTFSASLATCVYTLVVFLSGIIDTRFIPERSFVLACI